MSALAEPAVTVSLTPLPLEADSRAFRIACSLGEAGFRSIVIEGAASHRRFWDDRIEVRPLGRCQPDGSAPGRRLSRGRRLVGAVREGRAGALGHLLLGAGFYADHWWRYGYRPRQQLPSAALYYLHSFEFYQSVRPLATRAGAAVIYDAHDFYRGIVPARNLPPFDRRYVRPYLDRLEDRVLAEADAIVTVSDGVAGLIEQACGRRPAVIRNCHDERHDRAKSDLRAALRLSGEDRLCVVVGNLKPGMAIDAAIAALALLPERFHLAFLGRGYDAAAAVERGSSVARRLHFGHVVAPNEIVPAIRSADIGLVVYEPLSENYRFALPNGFFQVLAAGLPLVRGYLPEIEKAIGRGDVGQCLQRLEPASLAQAIADCAERAAALRPAAAALARELRWEREALRLRPLVEAALARSASTRAMPAGVAA